MPETVRGEAVNGDVRINFEVRGPSDGPTMMLVAGLGEQIGSVEFPASHADRFVEAGFRVVRLDNRDAGLSTAMDDVGRPDLDPVFTALFANEPVPVPYSFRDMADDVLVVADAIDATEVHLLGASMGGWIVRWAAVCHPDRVKSLTVVMSGAGADMSDDGPQLDPSGLDELLAMSEHRSPEEQIAYTVELWRADWGSVFAFDEACVRDQVAASFARSYRPDGIYRQILAGFGSTGLWSAQAQIDVPTLVMHGTQDQIFPLAHGEATAEQIPNAEMWTVDGMGHSMPPELWDEMVNRITALSSS